MTCVQVIIGVIISGPISTTPAVFDARSNLTAERERERII
jgi:hypothetical protein